MLREVADKAGSSVNIGELVFSLTRNITYRAAFGSSSRDGQDEFVSILQEFSKLMGAFNVADFIPIVGWFDPQGFNKRLAKARGALDRFIDTIIDDHMAKKKGGGRSDQEDGDMVDDLLAFFGDGGSTNGQMDDLQGSLKLTRDNIKAIIMVMRKHKRLSSLSLTLSLILNIKMQMDSILNSDVLHFSPLILDKYR